MHGAGTAADAIANQDIRAGVSDRVTGILPPSRLTSPARPDRFGRIHANTPMRAYKGGGIAKRGMGAAYKSGGRVKSMVIAKRGGGAAKKIMRQNGVRSNVRFPYSSGMKKGGKAKKQGYKDREDESISARRGKESTKKQSFKDRRDESYGKWGKRKSGKINK